MFFSFRAGGQDRWIPVRVAAPTGRTERERQAETLRTFENEAEA
jgi:hypothetical protein